LHFAGGEQFFYFLAGRVAYALHACEGGIVHRGGFGGKLLYVVCGYAVRLCTEAVFAMYIH
jgi:hypothetical protein